MLRSRKLVVTLAVAALLSQAAPARALCDAPWRHLDDTGREVLQPLPLGLLLGSALAPLTLAPSGLDHHLRLTAQSTLGGRYNPEPISVWTPHVLLGGTLVGYGIGVALDSCSAQKIHSAMLQAAVLSIGVVGAAKWATGRGWPNAGADPTREDRLQHSENAQRFHPFAQGLAAFPSGHTAVPFALAAALRSSGKELGWLRFAGYPVSTAVGFAMWFGDHHWASDVISGALVGEAIGGSVGRAFSQSKQSTALTLAPTPGGGAQLVWFGHW